MDDSELRYLLGLTEGLKLASWKLPKLYEYYQSFEKIWHLPLEELRDWKFKENDLESLRAYKRLGRLNTNIEQLRDRLIWCLPIWHSLYPKQLKEIDSAPLILFGRGDQQTLTQPGLTVVGSRGLQPNNRVEMYELFKILSKYRLTIISGLARGTDALAHQLSLQFTLPTIAVVAHGLDMIYPPEHHHLALQIIENGGAIISEIPVGVRPEKYLFLARNRIMVALGKATLVVTAQSASGSMASATLAAELGRETYAFPGSPGCDLLIEEGANPMVDVCGLLDNFKNISQDE